jgi:adenylate kinase family enzyme
MRSTDSVEVAEVARACLGADGATAVERLVAEGPDAARLAAVRRATIRVVGELSTHRGPVAPLVRWRREAVWYRRGLARHRRPGIVLHGRGGGAGGLLVAVIGADGSGKSTLTKDLRSWFAPKVDTYPVYFGSGDGPASAVRAPLKILRRMVFGTKQEVARKEAVSARHPGPVAAGRAAWATALAVEKRRKLRRASVARTRGLLVITDRYPQNQVHGSTDGPLLSPWRSSGNGLRRRLATFEAGPYDRAGNRPPDLVLRLNVDPETARRRRPDHNEADLARRIGIIGSLRFPDARYGVVELDGSRPYDEVLARAKAAIFERL